MNWKTNQLHYFVHFSRVLQIGDLLPNCGHNRAEEKPALRGKFIKRPIIAGGYCV